MSGLAKWVISGPGYAMGETNSGGYQQAGTHVVRYPDTGFKGSFQWYDDVLQQKPPGYRQFAQDNIRKGVRLKKISDVLIFDAEGRLLKTCDTMAEAEREAKRLVGKEKDEVRIVRCVKVLRPKPIEIESEDL